MLQLPLPEKILFLVACALYGAAAIMGWIQLSPKGKSMGRFLLPLLCLALCLEMMVLVFRAVSIKGFPLTGLFESMLVLTVVLAFVYILLSMAIPQVWFSTVMAWALFLLVLLAALVAEPAATQRKVAVTPWMIFHGLAMVLSSVAIVFSAASAFLYLLSDFRLKQKKVLTVLGRVPNTEWLRQANHRGLLGSFACLTLGLASGIGLAVVSSVDLEMQFSDWILDPKILCIAAAWLLLLLILCLHHSARLSDKKTAYATVLAFMLILFAVVGVTVIGSTVHGVT